MARTQLGPTVPAKQPLKMGQRLGRRTAARERQGELERHGRITRLRARRRARLL